eukprot:scaffold15406_cov119-Isochrysis_galbana.AAC.12
MHPRGSTTSRAHAHARRVMRATRRTVACLGAGLPGGYRAGYRREGGQREEGYRGGTSFVEHGVCRRVAASA